jgi:hypothetical protein
MSAVGSPHVCGCPRKVSTSYYGACWPDLAPGMFFCRFMGVAKICSGREVAGRSREDDTDYSNLDLRRGRRE